MILADHASGRFLLHTGDDMINTRLRQGQPWEPLTQAVAGLLLKGRTKPVVVDIGANLGAFAIPIGRLIRPMGGILHAFEAQRLVYYQLCANLLLNELDNGFAHHQAVGSSTGFIDVPVLDLARERNIGALSLDPAIRAMQGTVSTLSGRTEAVSLRPLDNMDLPPADLVKIDVEGMELEVLQGGRNWLALSGYPPLLFEVWGDYMPGYMDKKQALMALVDKDLGYQVTVLGELAIAQHTTRRVFDIHKQDNQVRFVPLAK